MDHQAFFFFESNVKNNAMVTSTALLKQIPETKISVHGRHGVSFEWQNCCLQRLQIRIVILTAKKLSNNPNKQTGYLLYCFSS